MYYCINVKLTKTCFNQLFEYLFQNSDHNKKQKTKQDDSKLKEKAVEGIQKPDINFQKLKANLEYDLDKVRSTRMYLNFTVKKRTDDIPQKNMMAVPIVREDNAFEYVTIGAKKEKLEKIEFAYVPKEDVMKLQRNKVYSFEQHNSFLSKYQKRTLYCLNPKNYEFDIGISMVCCQHMIV